MYKPILRSTDYETTSTREDQMLREINRRTRSPPNQHYFITRVNLATTHRWKPFCVPSPFQRPCKGSMPRRRGTHRLDCTTLCFGTGGGSGDLPLRHIQKKYQVWYLCVQFCVDGERAFSREERSCVKVFVTGV